MIKIANLWEKYYIYSTILTWVIFLFYLLWYNNSFLYSSILDYKNINSNNFNWAIYPIEFVPNPLLLTYEQRKKKYTEIDSKYFIKTPIYDPEVFWKALESLKPWTEEYNNTITERLIYTVPYLWTYNFDYKEYSWSHPWIDIIAPEWTPVLNIAEWIVVQTWYQPWWFWNYVMIKHNNARLPNWEIWIVYSMYAHLSYFTVKEWTKIKIWNTIWYVWQTGTATTPHLHFQIELDNSPFAPFWPFSTLDMKNAKVWFFDWVNIWLWKEKALLYTINPLKFINKNLLSNWFSTNDWEVSSINKNEINKIIENQLTDVNDDKSNENISNITNNTWSINSENTSETVENTWIIRNENIENNNIDKAEIKKEELVKTEVTLLNTINADLILNEPKEMNLLSLTQEDLWKNLDKIDSENDLLNISWSIINNETDKKEILNTIEINDNSWNIINNNSWIITQEENIKKPIIENKIFEDIKKDYKYFKELEYFKWKNIISWFEDWTFKPRNNITRIESLKIILLSKNIKPIKNEKSKFIDIKTNSWENTYINSAIWSSIVTVENQKFNPLRNVTRVEVLKLILTLNWINLENEKLDKELEDININDWYYKYVSYAVKNSLFEIKNNKFYPNKPVTREELIYILYKYISNI